MSAKLYHKTFPGKLEQSFRVLLVLQNKSEQKIQMDVNALMSMGKYKLRCEKV